jgi:uncharacterized protein with von Willebrand factor type A (vWA) domain
MRRAGPDLVVHLTRFCRLLRDSGMLATPGDSVDAARALALVDVTDSVDFHAALKAVLVHRLEDVPLFEECFSAFWAAATAAASASVRRNAPPVPRKARAPHALNAWAAASEEEERREEPLLPAPSELESRRKQDFGTFDDAALREVMRVAHHIARRLAMRKSRRWKPAREGARPHLRRTLRLCVKTGGELGELAYREPRVRRTKLVVLADVSGSMELYARLFLQFLFALQHSFARVETFVFSTQLSRITEQLKRQEYALALAELSEDVTGWNGGTRIGESLRAFVQGWPRLLDRNTVVIVLSDGCETGDPVVLGETLAAMRRRAARLVWLNPLLGSPDYEPLTQGMVAALPHLDVFAPAHDVASLGRLARHLAL